MSFVYCIVREEDFSPFLIWAFSAANYSLYSAFTVSHKLWCCIFIFIQFDVFYFSLRLSHLPINCLKLCCLMSRHLKIFCSLSVIDFQFDSIMVRKHTAYDFNYSKFILQLRMWSMYVNIPWALEKSISSDVLWSRLGVSVRFCWLI